jgi:hypothetical protein
MFLSRYDIHLVNGRYLLVLSALLLWVEGAYGGWYQLTKDGKTRVWNDQRGLREAMWSGDRDQERYATGEGTLTWYQVERKIATDSYLLSARAERSVIVATYSGKMVRGKFDGPVVDVDANGNTFNGTFVNGTRVGAWVFAPAPSPSPARSESVRPADRTTIASSQRRDEQAHRDVIAKAKPEAPQVEPSPIPAPRAESIRPPDRTAIAASQRRDEQTHRDVVVEAKPESPAEGPSPVPDEKGSQHASVPTVKEMSSPGIRDPLFSLTNPPSLLRMRPAALGSPPVSVPTAAASSSQAPQQLTEQQVVALADAEAQKNGYNLGEYQRSWPKYVATDGVWLISYYRKYAGGVGNYLSVTVEDRTKKTTFAAAK